MRLGFAHVLTLMMFWLRATDVIDWSWWLVFTPILILFGFEVVGAVISKIIAEVGGKNA